LKPLSSSQTLELFNEQLNAHLATLKKKHKTNTLARAFEYPIHAGGKRIRPLLTMLVAGMCGGNQGLMKSINAAIGIEFIHTYSLVHDDLPALDNDSYRRGQLTTHKVFGENFAILVGDALLSEAFNVLGSHEFLRPEVNLEILRQTSKCIGTQGMLLGQWLDLENTNKTSLLWENLENIHIQKTGKLFGCSVVFGTLCGLNFVHQELIFKAQALGENLGLAFQIIDDILDETSTLEKLGKTAGKDNSQNKITSVNLLGLPKARSLAQALTQNCFYELDEIFNTQLKLVSNQSSEHEFYYQSIVSLFESLTSRSS
jgi:geranylgeranyl pyrophosphate synthase